MIRVACSGLISSCDPDFNKVCAVVSLVLSRQNCTNHRHTDPLIAHIDTDRHDLMRIDHPNKAHSGIIRDACSGLTSIGDPVLK